ncbi:MAG: glycosyltransferase family 4 protein [Planctomycetota bacterium]|jgi:glycosyltransferase involved in cell wall biosynthesis
MKVLHIITRMILGGAQENTLLSVLGQQKRSDYEVTLLTGPTTGPEGCILPELTAAGGAVLEEPSLIRALNPLADLKAYCALRNHIRRLRPEVVHTHSSKAGILGRLAAWHEGVPFVVHTIHGLPFHPYQSRWAHWLYIALEKFAAHHCHKIVGVADAMRDTALAKGIGTTNQYQTVYSGMRTKKFLRRDWDVEALRARWGLRPDDFVIGKVARLFELKGHEYLVEAFGKLAGKHPTAKLFLVGDGIYQDRFRQLAQAEGLEDRIVFAGLVEREEIHEAMAVMDLVVHCSLREGLARVLPQAFLSGKPVISFDVDGAREVVKPGETGWLLPPKDVQGLIHAITEAITHPDQARRYAEAGCALCRHRFDHHTMVEQLCTLYDEGIATSSR